MIIKDIRVYNVLCTGTGEHGGREKKEVNAKEHIKSIPFSITEKKKAYCNDLHLHLNCRNILVKFCVWFLFGFGGCMVSFKQS